MGSTRLPGKVMRVLGDRTVLAHVVERTRRASAVDSVVVATTTEGIDDAVVEECARLGVGVTRGSENDVLARYIQAFDEHGGDIGARITSDCPLLDPSIVVAAIQSLQSSSPAQDYLSNTVERSYPRGYDVEVFAVKALRDAAERATEVPDREHVTRYLYTNRERYRCGNLVRPDPLGTAAWRLTLDTEEDWRVVKQVVVSSGLGSDATLEMVERYLLANPHVLQWNAAIVQKTA